jgi:hypothetical protein
MLSVEARVSEDHRSHWIPMFVAVQLHHQIGQQSTKSSSKGIKQTSMSGLCLTEPGRRDLITVYLANLNLAIPTIDTKSTRSHLSVYAVPIWTVALKLQTKTLIH